MNPLLVVRTDAPVLHGPPQGQWTEADWEKLGESPSNIAYDEQIKLDAYARASVPEYAIIDPAHRQLRQFVLEAPGQYKAVRLYHEDDTCAFNCLPTIAFVVNELFSGAHDETP